jgi:hypothetical protein
MQWLSVETKASIGHPRLIECAESSDGIGMGAGRLGGSDWIGWKFKPEMNLNFSRALEISQHGPNSQL